MKWIFALLCLGLLLYEGYAIATGQMENTISYIMWSLSSYPFVPFVAGFLCGHFFWQKRGG